MPCHLCSTFGRRRLSRGWHVPRKRVRRNWHDIDVSDVGPISCQFDGIIILSVDGAISPVYLHVIHALSLSKTDRIEKRLAVPTAFLWPRETPTNYRRCVRANRPPCIAKLSDLSDHSAFRLVNAQRVYILFCQQVLFVVLNI